MKRYVLVLGGVLLIAGFFAVGVFAQSTDPTNASEEGWIGPGGFSGSGLPISMRASPNPAKPNDTVTFTVKVDDGGDIVYGYEAYDSYFFADCSEGLYISSDSSGRIVRCGGPGGTSADRQATNITSREWTHTWRYADAGDKVARVYVEDWDTNSHSGEDDVRVTVEPYSSSMDVTPDEPAGPNGDSTLAVGETEVYSATWSWSGESPKWRMWAEDSNGNIVSGTDTGQQTLVDNTETHQKSMSFSAAGTYTVCAWGSAEEPNTVASIERGGLFGFLLHIAHAARSGAGASDVECKDITVSPLEDPQVDIKAAPPGGSAQNGPIYVKTTDTFTLSWQSSDNVDTCTASNAWRGSKTPDGSEPKGPLSVGSYTYTITCEDTSTGATDEDSVTVHVQTTEQCQDEVDNDGDGLVDYPDDPGCTGPTDNNEEDPVLLVTLRGAKPGGSYQTSLSGEEPLNDVSLRASVSDSDGSSITYTFWCDQSGAAQSPITTTNTTQTSDQTCDYPSAGNYTAKVTTEQSGKTDTDTMGISVTSGTEGPPGDPTCEDGVDNDGDGLVDLDDPTNCQSDDPPNVRNVQANFNVCHATQWKYPIITWDYSGGLPQDRYRVQLWRGFLQIYEFAADSSSASHTVSSSYFFGSYDLRPDTTYTARVSVWDTAGESDGDLSLFQISDHRGPNADFHWSPESPDVNENVNINNDTVFYDGTDPDCEACYSWDFDGGTQTNESQVNPNVAWSSFGEKEVRLTATDSQYQCSQTHTIPVRVPLPIFQEIIPR